jgi:hypothetical protein
MESKKNMFWTAALAGAIGAGFGSASGSNNLIVVISVGVVVSLLAAWGISGMLK